jgi:hypothetical protein
MKNKLALMEKTHQKLSGTTIINEVFEINIANEIGTISGLYFGKN